MVNDVKYFAIVRDGDSPEHPSGLARRTVTPQGRLDETLRRDLTWMRDSAIYEWERGEEMGAHLVEISAADAERLIQGFRRKWGAQQG
ncbi:MAG TPA: hypothetical protein VEH31_14965 [Streptosporangiaceae bacterium]|nr:hypothetical protein [Streptosporangiaceae bacterium]